MTAKLRLSLLPMQPSSSPDQRKQFLAALALSAIYGIERFGLRDYAKAAWKVLVALTARKAKQDMALGERRMRHCEQCPVFFERLRTCGSPLADDPTLGCFCHLPNKVSDPKATCWADSKTDLPIGWASAGLDSENNPFPPTETTLSTDPQPTPDPPNRDSA